MPELQHALILLVEDDAEILEVMSVLLEGSGYSVLRAVDGADALVQIDKRMPDIIVSDIHMPKMNGFEFYLALRRSNQTQHIPFIFLTGFSDVDSIVRGRELGVDDYLVKPVDARLLLSSIRGKLKRADEIRTSTAAYIAELKNHLVQVLTHEFRTPLTLINSTTDMLADASMKFDPEELQQFLSMIKEGGARLQRLVESFLLASAIEAGESQKEYTQGAADVNLTEILAAAINDVHPFVQERSAAIDQLIPDTPCIVRVCQKHVFEILRRLLENAVKFGPKGSAILCRITDDGQSWVLSIEDHGRGIPAGELPKIITKFYQIDRRKFEQQGVGLGLYIADRLAVLNKLELRFTSIEGRGTTARLRFPTMRAV